MSASPSVLVSIFIVFSIHFKSKGQLVSVKFHLECLLVQGRVSRKLACLRCLSFLSGSLSNCLKYLLSLLTNTGINYVPVSTKKYVPMHKISVY